MKIKPILALLSLALPMTWSGCSKGVATSTDAALAARGDYLVNHLGMCIDCHSPRNEKGEFIAGKALEGAPIDFKPLHPMPWASFAPPLAGLPAGYTQEQLIEYLMTGTRPNGVASTLPPMPSYRMTRSDAAAITAYLASLSPRH